MNPERKHDEHDHSGNPYHRSLEHLEACFDLQAERCEAGEPREGSTCG